MLAILIAIKAYEIENNEPFSVDQTIFQEVIKKNIDEDLTPMVAIDSTEGNRILINVDMIKDEKSE
jgi:hypothetical protein